MSTQSVTHDILSGWKEIANHLGKGVRTVQRYERYSGLSVRRLVGHPRGSVLAKSAEVDDWVVACSTTKLPDETRLVRTTQEGSIEEFKKHLEQMRQLRGEMRERRIDLIASISALHKNVRFRATESCQSDQNIL